MTNKEIKDMSNAELKREWKSIEHHIKNFGYGKFELYYRQDLEVEMNKRDLD